MKTPRWLWREIDAIGRIPRLVQWFFPYLHWCPELDYSLEDRGERCPLCGHPRRLDVL